jgi:hypothetical protein
LEQILKGLIVGLEANGFTLDFEAKADIDGGFECYILSDKTHVAIITGENTFSRKKGNGQEMVYRHFFCQLGDQEYLEEFLGCIGVADNSDLLDGPYGSLFFWLINKVRQYGMVSPARFEGLSGHDASDKIVNHRSNYSKQKNVISLYPQTFSRKEFTPRLAANSACPSHLHPV